MKTIQSASEFLSVYGIALLIIAVVTVIIYAITSLPSSTVPNTCTFSGYVSCRNIAIGSNTLASRAILLFSNPQQYAVENAIPTINITNIGTFTGSCSPYYALPGGIFECVINFNKKMIPNQLSNGRINLSLTVCTTINNKNCGLSQREVYSGSFNVHISPIVPPPRCTITLSGNSVIPYGTRSNLTANVKLFKTNIAGATVNFTTANSINLLLSQSLVNTDSNGNATASIYSSTPGNYLITASFANCTVSNTITYQAPPEFLSVLSNGCGAASGSGEYAYGSNAAFSIIPYNGYTFTGWTGYGTGSYTGNMLSQNVILYNSETESASCQLNLPSLYSLNVIQNPPNTGFVSGSGYYAYGQIAEVNVSAPTIAGTEQYSENYFKPGYYYFQTPPGTSTSTLYTISIVGAGGAGGYGYSGAGASSGGSGAGGGGYLQAVVSGYPPGTGFYINVAEGAQVSNGQAGISSVSGPNFYSYSLGGQGGSGNYDSGGCYIIPGGAGGTAGASGAIKILINDQGASGQENTCTVGGNGGDSGDSQGAGGAGGGSQQTHNSNTGYPGGNFGGGGGGGAAGEGSSNKYCHGNGCLQNGGPGAGGAVNIFWTEPVQESNYIFSHWTCSGEASCYSGTTYNFTIPITSNTIETANFNERLLPGSVSYTSPNTYNFYTPAASNTLTTYHVVLIGAGGNGGYGYWGASGWNAGAGGGGGAYMSFNISGYPPNTLLTFVVGNSNNPYPNSPNPDTNPGTWPSHPWTYYANYGGATTLAGPSLSVSAGGGGGGGEQSDSGDCYPLPGGARGIYQYSGNLENIMSIDGYSGQSIGCTFTTGGAGGAGGNSGNNMGTPGIAGAHTLQGGNGGIWGAGAGGGGLPQYVDCHSIGCSTSGGTGAVGYAEISWG